MESIKGGKYVLYLIQHGEAKSEQEDPSRPLSEKGVRDVRMVASFISQKAKIEAAECIFHSGKLRAAQTAGILAEYIKPDKGVSENDGLAPMDSLVIWAERLKTIEMNIVLVGHLPHLSKLASLLLCGNPEAGMVNFKMGGVVCLKREEGKWSVEWMVVPEMLKD